MHSVPRCCLPGSMPLASLHELLLTTSLLFFCLCVSWMPSCPQPPGIITAEHCHSGAGVGGPAGEGYPGGPEHYACFHNGGKTTESQPEPGSESGSGSGGAWPLHPQPRREDGAVQQTGSNSHQCDPHQRGHTSAQGQRSLPDTAHHTGRFGAGRGGAKENSIYPLE